MGKPEAYLCNIFECIAPFYSIICVCPRQIDLIKRIVGPAFPGTQYIFITEVIDNTSSALPNCWCGCYRGARTVTVENWP
jgi:hypothetical protein